MNPLVGWALAAILAFFAWRAYGNAGLVFAASAIVFWLLLQLNRTIRAMKTAADMPVGYVGSAVMFHSTLRIGMTMLQVVSQTKSLGRKEGSGDDDWSWSDEGGRAVQLHFERGRLARWSIDAGPADESESTALGKPAPAKTKGA